MSHKFYDNNKILKPWGEEHVIFRNGENLCITLLKIKKNFSTSLHCHPKKKNWFYFATRQCRYSIRIIQK